MTSPPAEGAEQYLAWVADALSEPVVVIDPQRRVLAANAAARRLSPQQPEAGLCARLFRDPPLTCRDLEASCPLDRMRRGADGASIEVIRPAPGGGLRVMEIEGVPIRDAAGALVAMVEIARDVTTARQARVAAARADDEWAATANSVPDLLFLLDRDGKVMRCNRAAARLLGCEASALAGRPLRDLLAPAEAGAVIAAGRGELQWPAPRLLLELSSYETRLAGLARASVVVLRDVTALRRYQALATSVDLMNNLAHVFAAVRHEVGNPLNALRMALSVLRESHAEFAPEKVDRYLARCLDDVGRMQTLLERLRSFSIAEDVAPRPVAPGELLEGLAELTRCRLELAGIACEVREPEVEAPVLADPRALEQVVAGLIANSMDALQGRPSPRVALELRAGAGVAHLVVADNGAGIAEADRENAFLPLFTTKPKGTGLGLAIARNLVTRLGGTIGLRSEAGLGTEVEITLPLA